MLGNNVKLVNGSFIEQNFQFINLILVVIIIIIIIIIPADRNVVQKEAEKKLKYKSLCIEIKRTWNLKCTIVPVIIGATGIVTRSLEKNLETVPGKHSIDSLQKTALLGTSQFASKWNTL